MKFEVEIIQTGEMILSADKNLPTRSENGISEVELLHENPGIHNLKSGNVVIDVGAFIGDTAIWPLKQGCEVHAIEPFVDAYTCLLFNTSKYGSLAHCYHRACGNGEKVKLVHQAYGDNFGMRYVLDDPEGEPTLRLDDLSVKSCDFLKIDCEGRESRVLDGAKNLIARCRPKMFIEVFPELLMRGGSSAKEVEEKVRGMGYKIQVFGADPRWDIWCQPVA